MNRPKHSVNPLSGALGSAFCLGVQCLGTACFLPGRLDLGARRLDFGARFAIAANAVIESADEVVRLAVSRLTRHVSNPPSGAASCGTGATVWALLSAPSSADCRCGSLPIRSSGRRLVSVYGMRVSKAPHRGLMIA
jgi:hypothetical protein